MAQMLFGLPSVKASVQSSGKALPCSNGIGGAVGRVGAGDGLVMRAMPHPIASHSIMPGKLLAEPNARRS